MLMMADDHLRLRRRRRQDSASIENPLLRELVHDEPQVLVDLVHLVFDLLTQLDDFAQMLAVLVAHEEVHRVVVLVGYSGH